MREPLSVLVPAKNEARNHRACLDSARWAEELVVVDSGSTDASLEIARSVADRVLEHEYVNSAAQKNWALPQLTHRWVLIVDADERVTDELREEIQALLREPGPAVAYRIPRRNFYYGRWIRGAGQYPPQLRLVRRGHGRYNDLPVHEHLEVDGPVGELRGHLDHHTHPTVVSHELKIERYSTLAAEARIGSGNAGAAWYHLLFNPAWTFVKFYLFRGGYRDGLPGFIVSGFSAAHVLLKYAKLWERAHKT